MNSARKRAPFDVRMAFVAARPLTIMGSPFQAGTPVTTAHVNSRRLRQLYEARHLRLADVQPVLPKQRRPEAVGPTRLPTPVDIHLAGQSTPPPEVVEAAKPKRGVPRMRSATV